MMQVTAQHSTAQHLISYNSLINLFLYKKFIVMELLCYLAP